MNVQTKPAEDAAADRGRARPRARRRPPWRCATPTTDAKNKALTDARAPDPRREGRDPRRQRARHRGGQGRRHVGALQDRLLLNDARIEAMAQGPRRHRGPARSGRRRDRRAGRGPTASTISARARAARRHRHDLRGAAQRDRRCRRAVPASPAMRRSCAAAPRASIPRAPSSSCCAAALAARRPARGLRAARADDRPRRRRRDAAA